MSIADGQLVLLAPDQQQHAAEQQLTRQNVDAQVSVQGTSVTPCWHLTSPQSKRAAAWHVENEVVACRGAAHASAAGHLLLLWQSWRPQSDWSLPRPRMHHALVSRVATQFSRASSIMRHR